MNEYKTFFLKSVEVRGKKGTFCYSHCKKKQTKPQTVTFSKLDFFFLTKSVLKKKTQTNINQNQTNTAEVHAFIVVIISSSADCKTERTTVHEKHNSPKRTHLTYSQSQVLFIYSIFITFIHVYESCLDL